MRFHLALMASTLFTAALATSDVSAQSTTARTYDVVSEYTTDGSHRLEFSGVIHGASASSSFTLVPDDAALYEACTKALIQVVNRPGRLVFVVDAGVVIPSDAVWIAPTTCSVRQKP